MLISDLHVQPLVTLAPGQSSQLLPIVNCSSCGLSVPLADMGDHSCTTSNPVQDGALRRVRSAGDIPREPEMAHMRPLPRFSESYLDPRRDQAPTEHSHGDASSSSMPWLVTTARSPTLPTLSTEPTSDPTVLDPLRNEAPVSNAFDDIPLYRRLLAVAGIGPDATFAQKSLVSLFWNLSWGFAQVIAIVTILALTGTRFKSPTQPNLTEWKACDRPLGIWACLWVVRVVIASGLAYWEFIRDRLSHQSTISPESGNANRPRGNNQSHNNHTATWISIDSPARPSDEHTEPIVLPHNRLYSRLTLLSSLITLSWFLTAHILEYTSINTCRHSSPHLWWLTFGILCIMYLMVLEVIVLGLVVLLIAPILFVFWNIFLICIGRHPIQNPHMIKPEIGKLPKAVVDRIPLVMYIPPPPTSEEKVTVHPPLTYPPRPVPTPSPPSKARFKFIRNISSFRLRKETAAASPTRESNTVKTDEEPQTWEGNWEQNEYPFVVLEGNRAACAICLMDFEEPKRKEKRIVSSWTEENEPTSPEDKNESTFLPDASSRRGNISEERRMESLKLVEAGDGAQPLRLLACGHVFHKTCLDPWLTNVSGRCPVCQQAVELSTPSKKSRGNRRQGQRG